MVNKRTILVLALAGLFLTACGEPKTDTTKPVSLMAVNVVQPAPAVFGATLVLQGTVTAKEQIAVGTPLQGLQILRVDAEVGDWVKKGQVLAQLENTNVQAQLQQHTAQLAKAEANLRSQQASLKEAQTLLGRYRELIKIDAISRQEFDSQQAKVDTAQASVQTAQAEIAEIQAQITSSHHQKDKAKVMAPADGVVIARHAQSGSLTDNNALFVLAKGGVMEVHAQANTNEIAQLQPSLSAQVQLPDGGVRTGKVRLLPSEVASNNRLGVVKISLEQGDFVPSGTPATTHIRLADVQAPLALPMSAVAFTSPTDASVMVIDQNQTAIRKAVTVGVMREGQVQIMSGLTAEDLVVKQAGAFISEGDKLLPRLAQGENQ
ncbi:efflux RND transporter periplasmic adaptor subunit [Wielerella bovis]|uniref:efflux RND transporter periplasmic adaptor subunit n=1 Tax=Wielerella bovis TaxID=2917790 RepID=UPI0020198DDF|nr:efflux RND transporter periplasmic adaptor subunit [Wielerella bovis]ULJ68529.1 efflux RND transporter periplasmic adaptor subunit [Wielerella bovis]